MTWVCPHEGDWADPDPPWIEVTEVDNPIVAVLLGPDGDVMSVFHERRQVPFGFRK